MRLLRESARVVSGQILFVAQIGCAPLSLAHRHKNGGLIG
jgi:hypothetical protein